MNHESRITNHEHGVALLFTLIVMITLISLVGAYLGFVQYSTRSTGVQVSDSQAIYLADAALNQAIWYLKNTAPDGSTDGSWRTTAYPAAPGANPTDPQQETFGNGTFTMWVEDSDSNVKIYARGTVDGLERVIEQTVAVSSGGYASGVPEAFNYCMHSFGVATNFRDSDGTINNADVASTGDVKRQGSMTINNGSWIDSSTVANPTTENTTTAILADYKSIADNVESGGFVFERRNTYGSAGNEEIWYIEGNAIIEKRVTIYGTVIAENNIRLQKNEDEPDEPANKVTIDAASGYPALIAGNRIRGVGLKNSTISGLIYADANVNFNELGVDNSVTINGTIFSGNNTLIRYGTNFTINYDPDVITNPPPYFDGYDSSVTVTSQNDWNEI